jgi:hypothetical protein
MGSYICCRFITLTYQLRQNHYIGVSGLLPRQIGSLRQVADSDEFIWFRGYCLNRLARGRHQSRTHAAQRREVWGVGPLPLLWGVGGLWGLSALARCLFGVFRTPKEMVALRYTAGLRTLPVVRRAKMGR